MNVWLIEVVGLILVMTIIVFSNAKEVSRYRQMLFDMIHLEPTSLTKEEVNSPVIILNGRISIVTGIKMIRALRFLDGNQEIDKITIILNSFGGNMLAGLAICEAMEQISTPIVVYAENAHSSASLILAAGTLGERYIFQDSTVLIHNPSFDCKGVFFLMRPYYRIKDFYLVKLCAKMTAKKLSQYCHQSFKKVCRDMKKETFFVGEELIQYGFADRFWGTVNYS